MLTAWVVVFFFFCDVAFARGPGVEPEVLEFLRATGQHEEFAKLLGLEDVSLVLPNEERTEEDLKFTKVSSLGDILLTPEQEEQDRQGINFTRYPGSKWQTKVIPYQIMTTDYTASQIATIESAINSLSSYMTNLKIRKRTTETDYVVVFSGNGCYSNLGRVGGQQTLSLQSNGCLSTGTIQHEFLHAAGMMHEHCHPLRDNYVKVLFENIPPEWQSQYQKASPPDFAVYGPYDYYSVMHYPLLAPGTSKPAFQFYDNTVQTDYVGQRYGPTYTDISKVDKLYS